MAADFLAVKKTFLIQIFQKSDTFISKSEMCVAWSLFSVCSASGALFLDDFIQLFEINDII